MQLYAAIDLHSTNSMLVVLDEDDRVILERRLRNDLEGIGQALAPYRESIRGIAVESTYNWYWLVDALMEHGYRVHLVNIAAVKQYAGLKYSADQHDARWLAHLLRLGILPEGYIYPKEARAVRDLLRKRAQLVRNRTTQILSIQNLLARNLGRAISGNDIKRWRPETINTFALLPEKRLAIAANWALIGCLDEQIAQLEHAILNHARLRPEFRALLTPEWHRQDSGAQHCLGEGRYRAFRHGRRFRLLLPLCGQRARIQRQEERRWQHQERQPAPGLGHDRGGEFRRALSNPAIKRFYQRKAQVHAVVAIKSVAHKLARACYHVMRRGEPFEVARAFA